MLVDPVSIATQAPNARGKSAPAGQAAAATTPPVAAADEAKLQAAVRDANRAVASVASSIEFAVDQESGKTVVKVLDTETQQLIRQIPSPEMLDISHALDRMQGLLLKHKA